MPSKANRAAELVGDAVGAIEAVTTAAGSRAQHGLTEAASAIGSSSAADRVSKRTRPARRALAKKVRGAKKVAKKRTASATRKATGAKKVAKKRAVSATRKATGAKKVAKKRAASATRKATGAKRVAKKRAASATRKATGAKKRAPAQR